MTLDQMIYFVTTKHPTGYMDGTHTFKIGTDQDRFYASAKGFGCSKSYRTPESAIREMCADHACTVVKCVKA